MIAYQLNLGAVENRVEDMSIGRTDDSESMGDALSLEELRDQVAYFVFHEIRKPILTQVQSGLHESMPCD